MEELGFANLEVEIAISVPRSWYSRVMEKGSGESAVKEMDFGCT